jgi:energy-coupling factor transport system ATP-binding protein
LSEGEKKRLGLAILLARPGLQGLCVDEPTLGQDARHRDLMGQVVRHLASTGYLCVVATHDVEWAAEWGDEFVMLHDGRVLDRREAVRRHDDDRRLACGV